MREVDVKEITKAVAQLFVEAVSYTHLDVYKRQLYGCYTGLAVTMFNLVPTITTSIGVSAIPAVTSSWTKRDAAGTKKNVEAALRITAIIGIPAGLGMSVLAGPIMSLLFHNANEVAIATPLLTMLGLGVILLTQVGPINSCLLYTSRRV